jgi:hypothetical protein
MFYVAKMGVGLFGREALRAILPNLDEVGIGFRRPLKLKPSRPRP